MSYTGNPRAEHGGEISEGTGMINPDFLAAESLERGGQFADGNAAPSSQPSRSTTTNTTDTSGASTLQPASDRPERLATSDPESTNYRTPVDESRSSDSADVSYSTSGNTGSDDSSTGNAPSYVQSGSGDSAAKPKGKNITEGGFSSEDAPNASFNDDIGGGNDPGRESTKYLQNKNSRAAGDAGYPTAGKQGHDGGKGGFEELSSEEQA